MISTPDREKAVKLIDHARAQGARLAPACRILGISVRTYQRWTAGGEVRGDGRPQAQRPKPRHALTPEEEQTILALCHDTQYADLPPAQIIARVLDDHERYLASESTFYRILRRYGEQRHRGRAKAPVRQASPTTYRATGPCQVWTWDCTWLPGPARGVFFYLYVIVDIYSRKIVGWEVLESESAAGAARILERAILAEGCIDRPLVLHADNGSPMKGATLLETLRRLQIEPSFSRPRVSDDNAFSEALFRTCKYVPNYPKNGFADIAAARAWVHGFARWYNHEHRHSAIKYVTPAQRHRGEDHEILARRAAIYAEAKRHQPDRWSGDTRDWNPVGDVWLNPDRETETAPSRAAA